MDSEDSKTPTTRAIDWATSQSFNNVLLTAILCSIGWIGYYAITTAIPAHLQMIQEGYRQLHESHREERERMSENYNKWLDRYSARPTRTQD